MEQNPEDDGAGTMTDGIDQNRGMNTKPIGHPASYDSEMSDTEGQPIADASGKRCRKLTGFDRVGVLDFGASHTFISC